MFLHMLVLHIDIVSLLLDAPTSTVVVVAAAAVLGRPLRFT